MALQWSCRSRPGKLARSLGADLSPHRAAWLAQFVVDGPLALSSSASASHCTIADDNRIESNDTRRRPRFTPISNFVARSLCAALCYFGRALRKLAAADSAARQQRLRLAQTTSSLGANFERASLATGCFQSFLQYELSPYLSGRPDPHATFVVRRRPIAQ